MSALAASGFNRTRPKNGSLPQSDATEGDDPDSWGAHSPPPAKQGVDALSSFVGGDAFEGMDLRALDTWSIEAKIRNLSLDEMEARKEKERLQDLLQSRYGRRASSVGSRASNRKGSASSKKSGSAVSSELSAARSAPLQASVFSPTEGQTTDEPSSFPLADSSDVASDGPAAPGKSAIIDYAEQQQKPEVEDHSFAIDWIIKRPIPFHTIRNLRNPWREDRQIKVSRDGTELEPSVGKELLELWLKLPPEGCGSCGRAKPRFLENED